jgi:hypothetical protein
LELPAFPVRDVSWARILHSSGLSGRTGEAERSEPEPLEGAGVAPTWDGSMTSPRLGARLAGTGERAYGWITAESMTHRGQGDDAGQKRTESDDCSGSHHPPEHAPVGCATVALTCTGVGGEGSGAAWDHPDGHENTGGNADSVKPKGGRGSRNTPPRLPSSAPGSMLSTEPRVSSLDLPLVAVPGNVRADTAKHILRATTCLRRGVGRCGRCCQSPECFSRRTAEPITQSSVAAPSGYARHPDRVRRETGGSAARRRG